MSADIQRIGLEGLSGELHPIARDRSSTTRAALPRHAAAAGRRIAARPAALSQSLCAFADKHTDKLVRLFDDFRRSTAMIQIALIRREGLLTDDEMSRFTPRAPRTGGGIHGHHQSLKPRYTYFFRRDSRYISAMSSLRVAAKPDERWMEVDRYYADLLIARDEVLEAALAASAQRPGASVDPGFSRTGQVADAAGADDGSKRRAASLKSARWAATARSGSPVRNYRPAAN